MIRLDAPLDSVNTFFYTPDNLYSQEQAVFGTGTGTVRYDENASQDYFIPKFPDYTILSCDELKTEVSDLTNLLQTSRLIPDIRTAYQRALYDAQNQIDLRCGVSKDDSNSPKEEIFVDSGNSSTPAFSDKSMQRANQTTTAATNQTSTINADSKKYLYAGLGVVAVVIILSMLKNKSNG